MKKKRLIIKDKEIKTMLQKEGKDARKKFFELLRRAVHTPAS